MTTPLSPNPPSPPAEPLSATSPAWMLFFSQTAAINQASQQSLTAAQASATAAGTAATMAQTTANAAAANATSALAQIAAYLATSPIWVIGDYRQTALSTLGASWLPCDGSDRNTADYPNLSPIVLPVTGPGAGGSGTFKLPSISSVYGTVNPFCSGSPDVYQGVLMGAFRLIAAGAVVSGVVDEIEAHSEMWGARTFRTEGETSPHHGAPDIWLRYRRLDDLTSAASYREPHFAEFYPEWGLVPSLHPSSITSWRPSGRCT